MTLPLSVKEGNIIKLSYNDVVDELRSAKTEGKDWLAKLESEEREKTGIKNLRIKFNKYLDIISKLQIRTKIWSLTII